MNNIRTDNYFRLILAYTFFLFCGIILLLLAILGQTGEGYFGYFISLGIIIITSILIYANVQYLSKNEQSSAYGETLELIGTILFLSFLPTCIVVVIYEGPPPKIRIAGLEVIIPTLVIFITIFSLIHHLKSRSSTKQLRNKSKKNK